jgi:hypothetical protein
MVITKYTKNLGRKYFEFRDEMGQQILSSKFSRNLLTETWTVSLLRFDFPTENRSKLNFQNDLQTESEF